MMMVRSLLSTLIVSIFCSELGNAYISSTEKSFKQPPANIKVDDIFREEYHEWCKRYDRSVGDRIRFENFKLNFMLQMQHNTRSGTFNLLNEFGDSKCMFLSISISLRAQHLYMRICVVSNVLQCPNIFDLIRIKLPLGISITCDI